MDSRLKQDVMIEDALKSQSLAPMPRDITASVMAHIQKDERPALVTRNDFIIGLVIAICVIALFFTVRNLPPIMVMQMRKQSILTYQSFLVNARWLVPSALFGFASFFSALTIPYLGKQLKL